MPCPYYGIPDMGDKADCRYKIYVGSSLSFKFKEYLCQSFFAYGRAFSTRGDPAVLTEQAA